MTMADKKAPKKVKAKKKSKSTLPKSKSERFFNRELSWLEFNDRILHEARDVKNPLRQGFELCRRGTFCQRSTAEVQFSNCMVDFIRCQISHENLHNIVVFIC